MAKSHSFIRETQGRFLNASRSCTSSKHCHATLAVEVQKQPTTSAIVTFDKQIE